MSLEAYKGQYPCQILSLSFHDMALGSFSPAEQYIVLCPYCQLWSLPYRFLISGDIWLKLRDDVLQKFKDEPKGFWVSYVIGVQYIRHSQGTGWGNGQFLQHFHALSAGVFRRLLQCFPFILNDKHGHCELLKFLFSQSCCSVLKTHKHKWPMASPCYTGNMCKLWEENIAALSPTLKQLTEYVHALSWTPCARTALLLETIWS